MDDGRESRLLRAKVEEALRFFVKLPIRAYGSPVGGAEPRNGEVFLEIPGPDRRSIAFTEDDGRVDLKFGPAKESFDFSAAWAEPDAEPGPDGEADPEASAEDDFKEELEALVNATLDILEEAVFAARYRDGAEVMEGIFPAEEFEAMQGEEGFESASWNGAYTRTSG